MKKSLIAAVVLSAVSIPAVSFAGTDSGFYVGGSLGQSSLKAGDADFKVDESSTAYKIIGGFNLGLVPLFDLAFEADYRDFGTFENKDAGIESGVTSYNVFGLGGFDVGPIGIFAKLGYSKASIDTVTDLGNFDESDSSAAYGLGAKIQLGSFAIRAEYEAFDVEGADDLYMFSAGAVYTF